MPGSRRSLLLSLKNAGEALAISAPTVIDAARGRLHEETSDRRLERFAARVLANNRMQLVVRGRAHLGAGPYVIMSNHQSHYDVPVLYAALGGRLRMVAKKELFRVPVFGQALRAAGFIEVDRDRRAQAIASLASAKEQLGQGMHVWIAPEGTRSRTGELLPFKKGGFMLALETGMPILPVTVRGTRDALPSHGALTRRGVHVEVTIHPPIDVTPYAAMDRKEGRDALMARVREAIGSAL